MMKPDWFFAFVTVCCIGVSGFAGARWLDQVRAHSAYHEQLVERLGRIHRQLLSTNQARRSQHRQVRDLEPVSAYDMALWQRMVSPDDDASRTTFQWQPERTHALSVSADWTLHTVPWRYRGGAVHGVAALDQLERLQAALGGVRVSRCRLERDLDGVDLACEGLKQGLEFAE